MASYLTDKGENESVRVLQVGGFVAKNVQDALLEMWAVADGCKAKDFLYHATINPRKGVILTQAQWRQAVDRLEKNLGLAGHQRVVVEHTKNGRTHCHVVWNRVNPLTGITKKLSFDHRVCRETALQLSEAFGLNPTPNKGQSFKRGEFERAKRTGIDPRAVKAEITVLWNKAKSGQEFAANLAKHGYVLAKGEKSQFVILDQAGSVHGITRRINGATAKTIRRGMADVDAKTLPTIAEARKQIKTTQRKAKIPAFTRTQITHRVAVKKSSGIKPFTPIHEPTVAPQAQRTKPTTESPAHLTHTTAKNSQTQEAEVTDPPTNNGELDAILSAIAEEGQRRTAGASADIMTQYASRIDQARKTLPPNQIAGAIRAIIEARTAEIAALSRSIAMETAGKRRAAIEQKRGHNNKSPQAWNRPNIG